MHIGTPRKADLTVPYHAAAGTSLIVTLPSRLVAAPGPDPWLRDTVRTVTNALPPHQEPGERSPGWYGEAYV